MSSKKRIGKYIIFQNELLGQGAFSKVYNGIIEDSKEPVAIKVVAKSVIEQDEYTRNAFYSEIKIMKKLKCPNIIMFLDVHETKNNFYIVLEKAEGTLRTIMSKNGAFSEKITMGCLIQILNGFGELVKNGVIHRDLKPENILIRKQSLKIADFGFAKHLQTNSLLKTTVGTPAYMAPQILKEERYTYKCDIWSIGVITYELLVGRIPWEFKSKNNLESFREEILNRKVAIPAAVEVSDNMRDFIFGCLCIDEATRYDWEKIFTHKIFGERYLKNFTKEGSTKITFILSNFRMNLHTKNLSLTKILSKLGSKLTRKDFSNFVRLVYREITEEDINIFFNYIAKGDFVEVEDLLKMLDKYECRMTGVNLADKKMEMEVEFESVSEGSAKFENEGYKLMDRLRNSIEKSGLVISTLFEGIHDQVISYQAFQVLIAKIDPSLSSKDIGCLYEGMQGKEKGIEVEPLYRLLYKIAQDAI